MFKIFFYIPIYINQIFSFKKNTLRLIFKNKCFYSTGDNKFGESGHYHNLKINNKKINYFLDQISNNRIKVISMPAAIQKNPGPISNDILNNIFKMLENL